MSTQLTTKDAEQSFIALKTSAKEIAEKCSKITIADDTSLLLATQQYSLLKGTIKDIETLRVKEKAPYLDAGKQIDALAKTLSSPLEIVLSAGEKKILAYNKEKQEKAQAEINRINALKSAVSKYSAETMKSIDACKTMPELAEVRNNQIVNKVMPIEWTEVEADYKAIRITLNDYAMAKRIEIETPAQADETLAESIKEAVIEKVEEVGQQEVAQAEFTTTSKIKGTWRFEVVDLSLVSREFLMIDEKKVKEYVKKRKDANTLSDGLIEDGIKFFIEESVNIR